MTTTVIEHHGIKGMKWGVRKSRSAMYADGKKPSGGKRKAKPKASNSSSGGSSNSEGSVPKQKSTKKRSNKELKQKIDRVKRENRSKSSKSIQNDKRKKTSPIETIKKIASHPITQSLATAAVAGLTSYGSSVLKAKAAKSQSLSNIRADFARSMANKMSPSEIQKINSSRITREFLNGNYDIDGIKKKFNL